MNKHNNKQLVKLILIRQKKSISQAKLSELTGYTQAYISLLETGVRVPTYDNYIKISEALQCSVEELSDKSTVLQLLEITKNHIDSLSEVELEKVIDYIEVLKRGRR